MKRASLVVISACSVIFAQTARLEFEAASIRPSSPDATSIDYRGGPGTNDPTLFTCSNYALISLITNAYNIYQYQLSAPAWMSTAHFDIRARVPQGATRDQFSIMLQNLLADRFKLVVRRDSRDMQIYELVIARNGPKFKPYAIPSVDPDSAPKPSVTVGNGLTHLYWPGMPMERLASQIAIEARRPVIDATGLKGAYEIRLDWVQDRDGTADATDAGPRIQEALQDQLGLRLESKKGPVEFIVVEHAEKVPTEN